MAEKNKTHNDTADRELAISRLLNAPVKLVWEVFTNPEHIAKWWGPNGFTNTISKMDMMPGGEWHLVMHGPDGTDYKNKSIFKEIIPHKKIVFQHIAPNFIATIDFEERGEQTSLNWHMLFETAEEFIQVVKTFKAGEGLKQNIEKLEKYLSDVPADDEIAFSRVFNAPVELVYKVWSEAEHLAKWWGPAGMKMNVASLDFRPGGTFHYSMLSPDGHEMWGKFVYKEIVAPTRIVFVNSFSDKEANTTRAPFNPKWPLEVLNVLTLSDEGGMTRLLMTGKPINATEEEHKLFIEMRSSLQQGFGGTFDQLKKYLTDIVK